VRGSVSETIETLEGIDVAAAVDAGGKRERSKAANRAAILEAARRVFSQLGYEATSVRDIIRGTDLASGTFYNYFKSKEEVFEALQDDGARRFRPVLRAQAEAAETFEDYVRAAIGAYFAFLAAESESGFSLSEGPQHDDTPEMRAVFEEVRGHIAAIIASGKAPPVDAEYFAAAAIGLAREVGQRMVQRSPRDIEGAAAFCTNLILGGVSAVPKLSA
jgi:AcrR family transcriptional regulator